MRSNPMTPVRLSILLLAALVGIAVIDCAVSRPRAHQLSFAWDAGEDGRMVEMLDALINIEQHPAAADPVRPRSHLPHSLDPQLLDSLAMERGYPGGWQQFLRQQEGEQDGDRRAQRVARLPSQLACPVAPVPDFPCTLPSSASPPGGNHSFLSKQPSPLHPRWQDIKLMTALGDSITAGLFVRGNRLDVFRHVRHQPDEDRFAVFSIGGDASAMTLASNLQRLSPDVRGLALSRTPPLTGPSELPPLELDLAQLSSTVQEVERQVDVLLERLRSPEYARYRNQWKMVSVLVGGINACYVCERQNTSDSQHPNSPESVGRAMDALLTRLWEEIPRNADGQSLTFVNVFTLFESISPVYEFGKDSLWCRKVQEWGEFCGCLYHSADSRQQVDDILPAYNRAILQVVSRWQARTRTSGDLLEPRFRVSAVRTLETMDLGRLGREFISRADCFHPSECYHRLVAFHAWNAMSVGDNRIWDTTWANRGALQWQDCSVYEQTTLRELY